MKRIIPLVFLWLVLALAAFYLGLAFCGCTMQVAFPTEVRVGNQWSASEVGQLVDAADRWRYTAGATLNLIYTDAAVEGGCSDSFCPVYPADGQGLWVGSTSALGVRIDRDLIYRDGYGLEGLRRAAMHEFGHVLGLGPPADGHQHIDVWGDIMSPSLAGIMAGDGYLSTADVTAYQAVHP